jgi:exopolyphosphatase / guanosine-5'-triphosphate,3'-diphosphate pyrophosphatase
MRVSASSARFAPIARDGRQPTGRGEVFKSGRGGTDNQSVNVAIIDVGSYTVRLLVCHREQRRIEPVREARAVVALGAEIEREGAISATKLDEVSRRVRSYARIARRLGVDAIEVIVTAPGRQSENADELLTRLRVATGAQVRLLSAGEEARFAYAGAISSSSVTVESVGVCDVGGGSTEVVVGTRADGPAWIRSFDIGALRLTSRMLADDPPGARSLKAARAEVESSLDGFIPPLPQAALATGGTARALRKVVGSDLGPNELTTALGILMKRSAARVAKSYRIDRGRARTLPAGAVILAVVQERLGIPICVARSGLREGVALAVLAEAAAA